MSDDHCINCSSSNVLCVLCFASQHCGCHDTHIHKVTRVNVRENDSTLTHDYNIMSFNIYMEHCLVNDLVAYTTHTIYQTLVLQ